MQKNIEDEEAGPALTGGLPLQRKRPSKEWYERLLRDLGDYEPPVIGGACAPFPTDDDTQDKFQPADQRTKPCNELAEKPAQ